MKWIDGGSQIGPSNGRPPGYRPPTGNRAARDHQSYSLLATGAAIGVLGIIGLTVESGNHSACDSTLGSLGQAASQSFQNQCAVDNLIYYLSIAGLVVGVAMVVVGVIMNVRHMPPVPPNPSWGPPSYGGPPPQPGPGWFPSQQHPGFLRWWNGYEWTEHEAPYSPNPTSPPPSSPPSS